MSNEYRVKHGAGQANGRRNGAAETSNSPKRVARSAVAVAEREPRPSKPRKETAKSRMARNLRTCVPFFTALALVTVLAWLLPLRPTVAEEERRELEKPPEFSVAALFDGSLFEQTEAWFSDTFTGRSRWLKLSQQLENLHGWKSVVIYGGGGVKDDIPVVTDDDPTTTPGGDDAAEPPVSTPQPSPTVTDPPAQPTPWQGDKVDVGESLNTASYLIQIGDTAYEWPGFARAEGENYCALINRAGDLVGDRCRVFSLLVPYGASVMLEPDFLVNTLDCALETEALTYFESLMTGKNVIPVRVIDALINHNSEYIYFRTDHHWTALGAYYAYLEWAKAAGVAPVTLDKYTEFNQGEYLGTYYESANQSDLLEANPDICVAYVPPGDLRLYINDESDDTLDYYGVEMPPFFDETEAPRWVKYGVFLAGDHDFSVLVNDSIADDSACLVYKNSMGNPFVYYLTQHYHTVYVADYRYYQTRDLKEMVDYYSIDDVIFLNNTAQAEWAGGNECIASQVG